MVHEHAGELVADRLMDQQRRHRGINPARKPAQHPALADLRPDARNRLLLEGGHGPVALAARDVAHEILDQRRALRRMHHFRVEHQAVELALFIFDGRIGRVLGNAFHHKARRQLRDPVAMAHPHRMLGPVAPHALEQGRRRLHRNLRPAEFPVVPALHLAAELRRQKHLAIADAEHRNPRLEHDLRRPGAVCFRGRGRPAREDHRPGLHPGKSLGGLLEGDDFRINPHLAHPPGNELGDLGTEVDNEDLVVSLLCHAEPLREAAGVCKMVLIPWPNPTAASC